MNQIQTFIKEFLSAPILFLVVIGLAIAWQQMNSKRLAEKSGQTERQAMYFSVIMAVSIFLCVANDWLFVAIIGALIEAGINVFLVLKNRQEFQYEKRKLNDRLSALSGLQKKGPEKERIYEEMRPIEAELSKLTLTINVFIAVLIPIFIVFMSELYIKSQ